MLRLTPEQLRLLLETVRAEITLCQFDVQRTLRQQSLTIQATLGPHLDQRIADLQNLEVLLRAALAGEGGN